MNIHFPLQKYSLYYRLVYFKNERTLKKRFFKNKELHYFHKRSFDLEQFDIQTTLIRRMSSIESVSRTLKPSHLKPPTHGHSAIPKFPSSRRNESSDAHKENESPARKSREPVTKRVSPQKSPSSLSQTRLSQTRVVPPTIPDLKPAMMASFDGSSITRSASDHSRFDGESVLSIETTGSRSTDGGYRSLSSGRSTATGAKVVRPPNTQSRFDVTLTKSSSGSSLPKPPPVKSTSSVRSSGTSSSMSVSSVKSSDRATHQTARPSSNSRPTSAHSSPAKSVRSGANSVPSSPSRDVSTTSKQRFSPAKESVAPSLKPSPGRKPAPSQSSPSLKNSTITKEEPVESMASMVRRINEDVAFFEQYFERAEDYVDVIFDDNLPWFKKWEKESQKIGGLEVPEFLRYCRGEDLLDDVLEEIETEYHG